MSPLRFVAMRSWWPEHVWRVRQTASAIVVVVGVIGVGAALLAGVLAARSEPPRWLLDVLEVAAYVLIALGLVAGVVVYTTRSAEKPRPFTIEFRIPRPPNFTTILVATEALVLHDVWIINDSDEHLRLQFWLKCGDTELGMRPYRNLYRNHRSAMKDRWLSNPRHLGPQNSAEGDLPFMAEGGSGSYADLLDGPFRLFVEVRPPGLRREIPLPTPPGGFVISGMANLSPAVQET